MKNRSVENIQIKVQNGKKCINKENSIRDTLDGVKVWTLSLKFREKTGAEERLEETPVKNFPN